MQNIYFNHDGNVDDLVSLLLLLEFPDTKLIGVGAVGADSYVEPAVSASRKIIDLFGQDTTLEVAKSNSRPVNQFPKEWRLSAFSFDDFPILNEHLDNNNQPKTKLASQPAHLDMLEKIKASQQKVTLIMTGPLTDLARAIEIDPTIVDNIDELFWMGGSMNGVGNVAEPEHDGTAEWNAYWDPQAVKTVFDTDLKITIVSLDSTNQVPLTKALRIRWAKQRQFPALDLIGQGYSLVHSFEANSTYYLWDVLTTLVSKYPELVDSKPIKAAVITDGPSAGKTFVTDNGRPLTFVTQVNSALFFDKFDELAQAAKTNY
ncbi:nucleoside hydrolase [Pediococcus pentosaceus]|uniref:ABC transporter substrate-binding protein n=2 Tax=Pediococcus pentosaceus TaxID=1255 RepID=A0A512K678_PEDPE|nr:nucleoside hydrolase [Pediococcus pentosaceus]KAF0350444.1 ABC transporter substrate-binding protein [Pediococcus pentosaceus]KAF0395409.1 ABC transporter substrate-binding protein [Pediococcus pentosaceus]KAF0413015.1 ABC transporter substrate-binding protein [Pediococcus pentosaceus]KAF0422695.1 ABC transporter substrate-binding protein [Pediococcus pentosaceus]KAF0435708.1 ABC transporter substrate-binding protein [Pediococcus pentosaceus]